MKKAVIFDLDGTLANTLESIAYCTNRALKDHGFSVIEVERFKKFVGNGARMQLTRALREVGDREGTARLSEADADGFFTWPEHLEAVLASYMEYFKKDCMYRVEPYEGIPALLAELQKRGIICAVFSNKPHLNTVNVVETLFGRDCFAVILGQKESLKKKPAPDGIWKIMNELGLDRSEILYVGDSSVDMDTGKAAQVETIGAEWGFRDKEELLQHGADGLVCRPEELLNYL